MDSKIKEIEKEINAWITSARNEYNNCGRSEWYNRCIDRICGMISVLQIITNKEYYYDSDGLHEKK